GDSGDDAPDAGRGSGLPLDVRDGRPDDGGDGDGDVTGDGDGDAAGDGDATGDGDGDATGDGDGDTTGDGDGDTTPVIDDAFCEIGIADSVTGLFFEPFPVGGTVPMIGTGQADLVIDLALLVYQADEPDLEVVVEAVDTGLTSTYTVEAEAGFVCAADMWCEFLPVLIDTEPLIDRDGGQDEFDLMRMPVTVTLTVSDATGPFCRTSIEGDLLRRE
ncbi:MAG: hypothetical protein OXT09_18245, partial [Myxococcales bacterium]|nr:hypothetical protein [Myxococcales bacterium]